MPGHLADAAQCTYCEQAARACSARVDRARSLRKHSARSELQDGRTLEGVLVRRTASTQTS